MSSMKSHSITNIIETREEISIGGVHYLGYFIPSVEPIFTNVAFYHELRFLVRSPTKTVQAIPTFFLGHWKSQSLIAKFRKNLKLQKEIIVVRIENKVQRSVNHLFTTGLLCWLLRLHNVVRNLILFLYWGC